MDTVITNAKQNIFPKNLRSDKICIFSKDDFVNNSTFVNRLLKEDSCLYNNKVYVNAYSESKTWLAAAPFQSTCPSVEFGGVSKTF